MTEFKFICPCHFGLESSLAFEIKKIDGTNICVSDGKVCFSGGVDMIAKANVNLRTAERVLILLGEFPATSFEELFQGVKALPLEQFIGKKDKFPVKGYSLNSGLHSVPDCQAIIKKAMVERLKTKYNVSWFEETGDLYQIRFSIMKDIVSVMLDTSGDGLHKRGYRKQSNIAPIKETLAAGIVDISRFFNDNIVADPFCGSGTIIIEAAMKAMNIAPGLNRDFTAMSWGWIPSDCWSDAKERARADIKRNISFTAVGYDIDADAVALTLHNAKTAGVSDKVKVFRQDISKFSFAETEKLGFGQGQKIVILCNPPYGKRLLEQKEAEKIYSVMGNVILPFGQNKMHVITPDEGFENIFGKKADKNRKLYNGMIMCRLYSYFKG